MTPKQVLARLAKRTRRCDDRPGAMPGDRVPGACPGWRIEDRPGGRDVRIVACAACNALQNSRASIDDAMARALPGAQEASLLRRGELQRLRQERSTTMHLREDPANMSVLCGHDLGRTPGGRRRHTWTYSRVAATCRECIRLADLTPEQRAAERAQKFSKFDAKKAELVVARLREREERGRQIEAMRPAAMVALDLVESQIALTTDTRAMLDSALHWAVAAYKHEHPKSRGDRLHVLRGVTRGTGNQHCRFCGEFLRASVHVGADRTLAGAFADISAHTIDCALKYLAGPLAPQLRQGNANHDESSSGQLKKEFSSEQSDTEEAPP